MLTSNHGTHRAGDAGPSLELQQKAIAAVETHPMYKEANAFPFCEPVIMVEPKKLIQGFRLSEEIKATVAEALSKVETFVLVSLWTSSKKPERLSGGGKTFDFILHPDTLQVVATSTGTWRS
jgi:hypothetical protein